MGENFNIWLGLLLLALYIAYDFIYAMYYVFVSKRQAILASFSAVALYLMSAFSIVSFLKNQYYIIFIIIGSFIGTYVAVKFFSDKFKKE